MRGEDFSSAKIRGDKNFSYNPKLTTYARENRKEMNEPEKVFWYQILHQEAFHDFHFRRQKPIGEYIVDFFCSELNLVIEIDGDSHIEQKLYDTKRTAYFLSLGLREVRFTNKEIMENTEGVFERLSRVIQEQLSPPTPPHRGAPNTGALPDPLLTILNEIRAGHVSSHSRQLLTSRNVPVETEDHTELFTRNVSVDAYNTDRLNAIAGDIFLYDMSGKGSEKLIESLKK